MDQQPTQWLDITDDFKAAAEELELGELAKSDRFSLHEAMTAIVIMNPKMDSGMFQIDRKVLNLEQSIKCGKLKVNNFAHQEMIGIIDETYACLATWLEGYSIAQTVMTNLYLHEPNRLEDKCMRIFCYAILKCAEMLREIAVKRTFFEEEEFLPGLNMGFNFADYVSDTKVLVSLKEICDDLDKRLASMPLTTDLDSKISNKETTKAKHDDSTRKRDTSHNDVSVKMEKLNLNNESTSERNLLEGLAMRMKYTRFFYHALMITNKDLIATRNRFDSYLSHVPLSSSSSSSRTTPNSQTHSNKKNFNITAICDNISRNLSQALELIDPWLETLHLGVERPSPSSSSHRALTSIGEKSQVKTNLPNGTQSSADNIHEQSDSFTINPDYPTIIGFEPLINQQLLPPAYPRCRITSREKSVALFRDLSLCLIHSCQATKLTTFESILYFLEHFSKDFKPSSCVISRSFLQLIFSCNEFHIWNDLIRSSIRDFTDPVVLQHKSTICTSDAQLRNSVAQFIDEVSSTFLLVIRVYGYNRALQREKLVESIESLKTLQYQAVRLDYMTDVDKKGLGPLVTWVTYHIVRLSIECVLLGFELELYSPHEYPYVYWYLYKLLYDRQTFLLNLARCSIEDQEALTAKSKNGKKINKSTKTRLHRPHQRDITISEALRCLSGGLYFTLSALKIQSHISDPKPEFSSEKIRFVHRFESITGTGISPDIRDNYERYQESLMHLKEQNVADIYTVALNLFSQARSLFELVPEPDEQVAECLRVVKTNSIVARVLASTPDVSLKAPVFDFSCHSSFPILKVL